MKILELTNYSAGGCGVFARVKKEAVALSNQGHTVKIFSSNFVKGTNEIAKGEDSLGKVKIKRFPGSKLGGESFMRWNFVQEAIEFNPDIIIAHSYRHYHTHYALKVAKIIGAKCFLVTHAPFTNTTRSSVSQLAVNLYDSLIGPKIINKFDKVIAITHWEVPFLLKIGCNKDRIVYIPNSLPNEFFTLRQKKGRGIIFLGRVSPIKNLAILLNAVKEQDLPVSIVGPAEKKYKTSLVEKINKENINNIKFFQEITNLKEKIKTLDKHDILVLSSNFESFGQVLIEAMARGKIVVASKTPGALEIISEGKNGFLFDIGSSEQLREILVKISNLDNINQDKIRNNAIRFAERFRLSKAITTLENLF
jgi:glycosyltransferase involved in cell wall biosynthesis